MIVTDSAIEPAAGVPDDGKTLPRSLHRRHVEMIAIGGIIGAGLFVGSSAAIASVGPAIVLSYAGAGLIVLLVMRMLSEMAMAIPGVQSFPEFARIGLGDWAGFVSGWLYWYFWVVLVAIEALAGASILHGWWPGLPVWTIAMALLVVLTALNLLSTRSFGEFEFWLSSIKVAAILVFILVAGAYAFGLISGDGSHFANLTAHGGFMPRGAFSILSGVTTVIFALVGAEIATVAAAETTASRSVVARMTSTVAVRILIFYVLSILLVVAIVPWTAIRPGVSPFAVALGQVGVPGGTQMMTIVVLVAVLSCLNSGIYVTSRVVFALVGKGEAPAPLAHVGTGGVPRRAILLGSVSSALVLATSIASPDGAFAFLVNASGAIMLLLYLLIALSQLQVRAKLEREAPERLAIRMWFHPWGSLFAVAAIIAVLGAMAFDPAHVAEFVASLIAVVVAALGFVGLRTIRGRSRPA